MKINERRYSILVISTAQKFNTSLSEMLPDTRCDPVRFVKDLNEAKRILSEKPYDLILINSPVNSDNGTRFAIDTVTNSNCVILILAKNEVHSEIKAKVNSYGIFTLPKPTTKNAVLTALDWMTTARELVRKKEKAQTSVEKKIEEIRLVNRAKWLLISELKLTEDDAHKYITKQAMDRCISKKDVATEIINTYS